MQMKQTFKIAVIISYFMLSFISTRGFIPFKKTNQNTKRNIQQNIKQKTNIAPLKKETQKQIFYQESWDDGEISWEIKPIYESIENYAENDNDINDDVNKLKITEREKIWGLVEELRIQGIISGFLSVAYYNTALGDNLFNDAQNFEIKPNTNIKNTFIENFNNELDILLSLTAVILYKSYKKDRIVKVIDYWKTTNENNEYINEYKKIRRCSAIFTLITIIIFCKGVKNAI